MVLLDFSIRFLVKLELSTDFKTTYLESLIITPKRLKKFLRISNSQGVNGSGRMPGSWH